MALVAIPFFVFAGVWLAYRRGLGGVIMLWTERARELAGATFSWLYLGVGALSILVVLLAVICIGTVRIGGKDAPMRVIPVEAVALGFAASTSVGLLFWAAGEPLFHMHNPPPVNGIRRMSSEAQILARSATYLHWAVLAHMTFGLFMIGFAIATGTLKGRRSVESVLAGTGLRRRAAWGDLLDGIIFIFAILALVAALASAAVSITAQGLAISGTRLGTGMLTGVLVALVLASVFLGARPLGSSLAAVARVSLFLLLIFLLLIVILGPKGYILGGGLKALWWMIKYFPSLMFNGFLDAPGGWAGRWTITHLGGWMLLAPIVGYALSRAARGYTLASAVRYLVIAPMFLSILTILVLGGLALSVDRTGGQIWAELPPLGTDSALLLALNELWAPRLMRVILLILSVLFFITFAGAATHAILHITVPGDDSDRRVIMERRALLLFWMIAFGFGGWCLLHYGGIGTMSSVSRLGAIPGVFITLGAVLAVFRLCLTAPKKLRPPEPVDPAAYRHQKQFDDNAAKVVGTVKRGHRRKTDGY